MNITALLFFDRPKKSNKRKYANIKHIEAAVEAMDSFTVDTHADVGSPARLDVSRDRKLAIRFPLVNLKLLISIYR